VEHYPAPLAWLLLLLAAYEVQSWINRRRQVNATGAEQTPKQT
jgi:hypothetical protein